MIIQNVKKLCSLVLAFALLLTNCLAMEANQDTGLNQTEPMTFVLGTDEGYIEQTLVTIYSLLNKGITDKNREREIRILILSNHLEPRDKCKITEAIITQMVHKIRPSNDATMYSNLKVYFLDTEDKALLNVARQIRLNGDNILKGTWQEIQQDELNNYFYNNSNLAYPCVRDALDHKIMQRLRKGNVCTSYETEIQIQRFRNELSAHTQTVNTQQFDENTKFYICGYTQTRKIALPFVLAQHNRKVQVKTDCLNGAQYNDLMFSQDNSPKEVTIDIDSFMWLDSDILIRDNIVGLYDKCKKSGYSLCIANMKNSDTIDVNTKDILGSIEDKWLKPFATDTMDNANAAWRPSGGVMFFNMMVNMGENNATIYAQELQNKQNFFFPQGLSIADEEVFFARYFSEYYKTVKTEKKQDKNTKIGQISSKYNFRPSKDNCTLYKITHDNSKIVIWHWDQMNKPWQSQKDSNKGKDSAPKDIDSEWQGVRAEIKEIIEYTQQKTNESFN